MVDVSSLGLVQQAQVELRTVWQTGVGWSFQSRSLDLAVFTVGTDLPLWKVLTISPEGESLDAPPNCGGAFQ